MRCLLSFWPGKPTKTPPHPLTHPPAAKREEQTRCQKSRSVERKWQRRSCAPVRFITLMFAAAPECYTRVVAANLRQHGSAVVSLFICAIFFARRLFGARVGALSRCCVGDVSLETERIPRVSVCVCARGYPCVGQLLHSKRAGSPVTMATQGFVATEGCALPEISSLSLYCTTAQIALRYASYTGRLPPRGWRFVLCLATDAE